MQAAYLDLRRGGRSGRRPAGEASDPTSPTIVGFLERMDRKPRYIAHGAVNRSFGSGSVSVEATKTCEGCVVIGCSANITESDGEALSARVGAVRTAGRYRGEHVSCGLSREPAATIRGA